MSRVGKLPIIVPNDIKVELKDNLIKISKGSDVVEYDFGDKVDVKFENNEIKVSPKEHFEKGEVSNFYGLHRNNIANIVKGLIKPFEITLEINGVGFKAVVVKGSFPDGVEADWEKGFAIDENGAVLADGDDVLFNWLINEQEELLPARIAADIGYIEHDLVEVRFHGIRGHDSFT